MIERTLVTLPAYPLLCSTPLQSSITGDPLHSRAACTQPCNVNIHSRAHCSPGARLCEQWGHGCVNNGARLCASARLCRGSPVSMRRYCEQANDGNASLSTCTCSLGRAMRCILWILWIQMFARYQGSFIINSLRPRQNGRHFTDDIFKWNVWIPIKISLKFVPQGPMNNIPALVRIMAWRRSGDKPLSEPVMVSLLTHICVTQPQWVKRSANPGIDIKVILSSIRNHFHLQLCVVITHPCVNLNIGVAKSPLK